MPQITFLPDQRAVDAADGESILQVALAAGIPHTHVCGSMARCSTCRVMVLDGLEHCSPRTEREQRMAERLHFPADIRLACQTRIGGDVTVRRLVLDADDVALTSQLGRQAAALVGEEKGIAILFADIRGFTALAEALPAYDVIHTLNRYFRQMDRVIRGHGGYIDNYIGDGLMALFGVDGAPEAPLRSVRAGLDMLAAVESLRPYLDACGNRGFRIGVGVHCGEVVVGSVGVENPRVTAIGDAVNFASRIEAATKETGASLLISADTYAAVKERVRIGREFTLDIRGKTGAHTLYEVVGVDGGGLPLLRPPRD